MRLRWSRWIAVGGVCLAVAGCAGFDLGRRFSSDDQRRTAPAVTKGVDAHDLAVYYLSLEALDQEELQREFVHVQSAVEEHHGPADRIRLAMLLGLPRAPFKNYDRSLTLFGEALRDPFGRNADAKSFLAAFSAMVLELKRMSEQNQNLEAKLKEERKQRDLLQQKLDELTTIEKKLLEQGSQKSP
jgi:S-adenosylmethionine:diacylglycerol 3-amino-3-carboxypropyl transferase